MLILTSNLVDGLGQTLDVASGDTGNGYSAVLGGIHGVLSSCVSLHLSLISQLQERDDHC